MTSWLTDALPYKNVHLSINLWLAKNGHPVHRMNSLEQRCFIGTKAMGL
jgi:serine/threonine-protein kinase HipA